MTKAEKRKQKLMYEETDKVSYRTVVIKKRVRKGRYEIYFLFLCLF